MTKCDDLLAKARANPKGLRFQELLNLAECQGWRFSRQKGSHQIYTKAGTNKIMTFQNIGGKAKPYQVRQLLDTIEE